MDKPEHDLRGTYRKERDLRVRARMLAVHMVCHRNLGMQEAADNLMQCPEWVARWVQRYREGGVDALRDLPRTGRPPHIPHGTMDIMMREMQQRVTPAMVRQKIRNRHGVTFHITHVRRIMHRYSLTPKTAQRLHVNHATKSQVRSWQYRLQERISRLKSDGFAIVVTDEAFFVHDPARGRKYWSPSGTRITLPYVGNHRKIAVYGAVSDDGRQLYRMHDRFDGPTFLGYVRELHRKFGRVAILCDRASPHRTGALNRFLRGNADVQVMYLPKGSPYLNAVEECWHRGKRNLLVSEYYATFAAMCVAVSEYYRTTRFRLDLFKYVFRSPSRFLTNLCS